MARQVQAQFTHGYIPFGKSPLIREEDQDRFKSLEDIDQDEVKIGVNPGGTNQKFVDTHIKQAQVTVVENNLEIPRKVASLVIWSIMAILFF